MKTLAVFALVLVGCVSEAYSALPQREQDRFQRCNNTLIAAQCAPGGDAVYRGTCSSSLANRYAERTTETARQQWLIENGCPPSMVGPVASSGSNAAP